MADEFDANLARVKAGLKGGDKNSNPVIFPKLRFVDGWDAMVSAKNMSSPAPQKTPGDISFGGRK